MRANVSAQVAKGEGEISWCVAYSAMWDPFACLCFRSGKGSGGRDEFLGGAVCREGGEEVEGAISPTPEVR